MIFVDRRDAGRRLARELDARGFGGTAGGPGERAYRPIVLGIPRGGVVVADEISRELGGDLGVVVARKLRAPWQPELAIGAVTADGVAYVNQSTARLASADEAYIEEEIRRQTAEAKRREATFDGHRLPPLAGRTVIVVDDGIATGATAIAALRSMRSAGASPVVLAVPVAPPDAVTAMRQEADVVVCSSVEPRFFAVGQFYRDFQQVDDDEVARLLEANRRARAA